MLCGESNDTSKYSCEEFVCGHHASSPASRAFPGYLLWNDEDAVMLPSGKSPFSNPSAVLLHVSLSVSCATIMKVTNLIQFRL